MIAECFGSPWVAVWQLLDTEWSKAATPRKNDAQVVDCVLMCKLIDNKQVEIAEGFLLCNYICDYIKDYKLIPLFLNKIVLDTIQNKSKSVL